MLAVFIVDGNYGNENGYNSGQCVVVLEQIRSSLTDGQP
jgi:hypothetical protein